MKIENAYWEFLFWRLALGCVINCTYVWRQTHITWKRNLIVFHEDLHNVKQIYPFLYYFLTKKIFVEAIFMRGRRRNKTRVFPCKTPKKVTF